MSFMLKIQWDIKAGHELGFRTNQKALCKVMLEHPGVICYHVDYPSERVSQWTESMQLTRRSQRTLPTKRARILWGTLLRRATRSPVNAVGIQTPGPGREILVGFATTYHETARDAFVLHPRADRESRV